MCRYMQVISTHYINPSLVIFFWKFDREIIWKFCVLLGCYSLALLMTHFISFEVQRRLSFFPYTIKASHDHSRMVEIIGIRNYALHDTKPGHQLNVLWQNVVSDLYMFDHQRVNISLGSILERFIPQSKVDHSEIWSFVKCGFLSSSCISQFANMEIICKCANWE